MTKKAFDKIAGGLREAIAVAKNEREPAKWHIPPEIDVKAIRKKTGLSQDSFAQTFGFSQEQVRAWEQARARPTQGVRAYLLLINENHATVLRMLETAIVHAATPSNPRKRA